MPERLTLTYFGGPTVAFEFGGVRPLTDPTVDPGGGELQVRSVDSSKTPKVHCEDGAVTRVVVQN
jgi:hypothetical protein